MQLYKACEAYQTTYVEWTWTELWSTQIKDQAKETLFLLQALQPDAPRLINDISLRDLVLQFLPPSKQQIQVDLLFMVPTGAL